MIGSIAHPVDGGHQPTRMQPRTLAIPLWIWASLAPLTGHADAVIRSQAVSATTIVEYFIEKDRIGVELEIGLADLPTFANLLPDAVYDKLGHPPVPLGDRLPGFFETDLVIAEADGAPLAGRLLSIEPRKRITRDEITGEPLTASTADEDVVFARLEYALEGTPASLTLLAPRNPTPANIGFVAYHQSIAVNDFRYLGPTQTLDLDWHDPWYTAFRTRGLRRAFAEPMSGFIYVEPYEVRKEIIVRPLDLQPWIDLGLAGRQTIPVEMQADLKRRVGEFLRGHHPVRIDGEAIEPELARIGFLERTLTTSRIVDPPIELDIYSAILGVIFVYPTDGLPERVTMEWDLWSDRTPRIPASSVDQAGPLPTYLEPDFRVLEWQNFLRYPELPTLQVLSPPPGPLARATIYLRWVLLALLVPLGWWCARAFTRRVPAVIVASLATAAVFWLAQEARLSDARARDVVSGLLHNVYRAFDFRDEEQIYDTLEKSVTGELLAQVYLETRRSLELAGQGGARTKVKELELLTLESEPADDGGFVATTTWNVRGSVGHWGHLHERRNQYRAALHVSDVAGVWKLERMDLLGEERL